MHRQLPVILAFLFFGLAVAPVVAETLELMPARDNTLFEDGEGRFSNGGGKHLFIGRVGVDGQEELRRTVVAFDFAAIPPNAIIDSVQLEVTIVQVPTPTPGDGLPVDDRSTLHRVLSDWGEGFSNAAGAEGRGARVEPVEPEDPIDVGAVTWIHTFFDPDPGAATFWASPGGDFMPAESASVPFGTSNPETIVFVSTSEMVADVQLWVMKPAENFGWLLRGDEIRVRNARGLASRENPNDAVPKLVVNYTIPSVTDNLSLAEVNGSLTNPVSLAHAGDGSGRLFVVEQEGIIRIFDTATGILLPAPFLNIQDEVFSLVDSGGGNEQGLLGLAFHPNYAVNGLFYVNYTIQDGPYYTVVVKHNVSMDPDLAIESGEVIMKFEQEARNHNGGDMHFGPDGYLYIASGDGGGGDDQYNNAQDVDTLRGAMLRIDVDTVAPGGAELCSLVGSFGIPPNNAFPGAADGCDEILHIGLRNPWRFSFDAESGDLLIADVGQGDWEEVNHVPGSASGLNFGWPCREGQHDFPDGPAGVICPAPLTEPVLEYEHVGGNCSVTGGYVYRGNKLPLTGDYLFGDWCSRRIWIGSEAAGSWSVLEWEGTAGQLNSLSSFGQDENCELYITDRTAGKLFLIEDGEIVFKNGLEQSKCQ
jgi:glucose/arabinose dehydrogenase